MLRVALDCRVVSERMDGLSRYAIELTRALAQRSDVALTVLAPRGLRQGHPLWEAAASPKIQLFTGRSSFALASHALDRRLLKSLAVDVYHYPHFNLPLGAPDPIVLTLHDTTPMSSPDYFARFRSPKRLIFKAALYRALRRSAAVIVPSTATAIALSESFPWSGARTHVIYEGIAASFATPVSTGEVESTLSRHNLARPFVLSVGVTRPHKNLERLLEAFASVADKIPHELVLVGHERGDTSTLHAHARELRIEERVRWLGHVSDRELRTIYVAADVFVLCSLMEGFGLPVLEAMASGAPVVVSNTGAAAEIAGAAAELVDPLSSSSIAGGLLRTCIDQQRRQQLRDSGYRRAGQFGWAHAADQTLALYRAAARGR